MRTALIDALEDLASSRTSRHARALSTIECLIAKACVKAEPSNDLTEFLRFQGDFECNVASRLALYLMYNLPLTRRALETLPGDAEAHQATIDVLTQPILQTLSILQGMSLIHSRSKTYLGRKTSIQTLLDILSLSRHVPPSLHPITNAQRQTPDTLDPSTFSSANSHNSTFSSSISVGEPRPPLQLPTLALAVLDTLLCILVDSPLAMRVFEEANGVEAVVKTLKRSGGVRDVRVKCLEFLYFYLLPEDEGEQQDVSSSSTRKNEALSHRVLARAAEAIPSDTDTTPPSSPSKSQQSSFTTTSSFTTQSTSSPSPIDMPLPSSPIKTTHLSNGPSLRGSPTKSRPQSREHSHIRLSSSSNHAQFQSDPSALESIPSSAPMLGATNPHLAMLRREVDFVPQSPKKKQIARLGIGKPVPTKGSPITGLGLGLGIGPGLLRQTTDDETEAAPTKKPSPFASNSRESPRKDHSRHALAAPHGDENGLNVEQSSKRSTLFSAPLTPDTTIDDVDPGHPDTPAYLRLPMLAASPSKTPASKLPTPHGISRQSSPSKRSGTRTTAEKKEMLGAWLGNVDALVDGVQRAGVWGLA